MWQKYRLTADLGQVPFDGWWNAGTRVGLGVYLLLEWQEWIWFAGLGIGFGRID